MQMWILDTVDAGSRLISTLRLDKIVIFMRMTKCFFNLKKHNKASTLRKPDTCTHFFSNNELHNWISGLSQNPPPVTCSQDELD